MSAQAGERPVTGLAALLDDPLLRAVGDGGRPGLLALDYDGTLAPFRAERHLARPWPGVAEILSGLPVEGPGRYVLVSGRGADEAAGLLGVRPEPEVWGSHGAQRRLPGGTVLLEPLPPVATRALERAAQAAEAAGAGERLERKPLGLALHWRGLEPGESRSLLRRVGPEWEALARETGLCMHPFDGGLELRPEGWDKGRAVRTLLDENPGAALVFLGDDLTDEDGFRTLAGRGVGVLVRAEPRASAARYRLEPPGELLEFLRWWAQAARRSAP